MIILTCSNIIFDNPITAETKDRMHIYDASRVCAEQTNHISRVAIITRGNRTASRLLRELQGTTTG